MKSKFKRGDMVRFNLGRADELDQFVKLANEAYIIAEGPMAHSAAFDPKSKHYYKICNTDGEVIPYLLDTPTWGECWDQEWFVLDNFLTMARKSALSGESGLEQNP